MIHKCRHFNGIQHDTCDIGVSYDSVRGTEKPYKFPCLYDAGACDKLSRLTDEEVAAREREITASIANIEVARDAVVTDAAGKTGISGAMDCPICKTGKLRYSIARSNGHIHAGCTTPKCVRWME